jgi:hypothetical protein
MTSPKKSEMIVTEQLDDTAMASGSEPEDRSDGGSESERSAVAFWQNRQTLLRDASTDFGKVSRQDDARRFHSTAIRLPYLPRNIRDAVNQIGNLRGTNHDLHVGVHLSDVELRQLNTISDPTVRATFRQVFVETAIASLESSLMITKSSLMITINNHVIDTTIATIRSFWKRRYRYSGGKHSHYHGGRQHCR